MPETPLHLPFIQALKRQLSNDLPGFTGQQEMMPAGRTVIPNQSPDYEKLTPAAVLIALFQSDDTWYFPLIKRVEDGFAQSGQVALPGGRLEDGESVEIAALREAEEEVGLLRTSVTLLGKLSPLPIPISGYLVHPVVGVLDSEPVWTPQIGEVEDIFTTSIDDILDEKRRATEVRHFRKQPFTVPYFNLSPYKVWGATAMILAEFEQVLRVVLNHD